MKYGAGLTVEERLARLEQVAGRGENVTTPYYASMYVANSGAPTHTSSGNWQKVGSGGGTATWTAVCDIRPSGVSAQLDLTTNKRIDVRKTGIYRVGWCVSLTAITDGKVNASAVYRSGVEAASASAIVGAAATPVMIGTKMLSLTSGQYLELYAFQQDSASEAYYVALPHYCFVEMEYIGPAA